MNVYILQVGGERAVGYIPGWLDVEDPRPAREQLDSHYQHGGGWRPFIGFEMAPTGAIRFPGDPEHKPLAVMKLRQELILIYQHGWVAIVQRDESFEIARMD